jgi:hypothetical protein
LVLKLKQQLLITMVRTPFILLAGVCLMLSLTPTDAQRDLVDITIEAETAVANRPDLADRIMDRSNAMGNTTVYLFSGESLNIPICVDQPGFFGLTELRYSNDGYLDTDTMEAFLDGVSLGTYETFSHTDWGHKWNVFLSYSGFARNIRPLLNTGRHMLTLMAASTDLYGVEIDSVSVRITGQAAANATPKSVQCLEDSTATTTTTGTD